MNRRFIFLLIATILIHYCAFAQSKEHHQQTNTAEHTSSLTVSLIAAEAHTWGYDIFRNGRLYIHQPSIPGLPGNKGFDTKQGARKAADIVCKKIRRGVNPPTVSVEELKSAHLIPETP